MAAKRTSWARRALLALLAAPIGVVALAASAAVLLGFLGPLKHDLDAFATLRPQFSVAALAAGALLLGLGSRRLAGLALGTGAIGLALLGPAWRAPAALPADCAKAPFRVVVANVEAGSATPLERAAALRNIAALDADVVAFLEMSPEYFRDATAALPKLGYSATRAHSRGVPAGAMLVSNRPLRVLGPSFKAPDTPGYAAAAATVGGREIGLLALHLARPVIGPQARQIAALPALTKGMPRLRVVLGDLNAAPWGHAVAEVGRLLGVAPAPGFRRTWRGRYPIPLVTPSPPAVFGAQIDHVLVSDALGVARVDVVDLPGSVHWGVVADLEIPLAGFACRASTKR